MSTSIHVVAIKPPDEDWRKKKAVWDACTNAGIEVPDEICDYFEGAGPDEKGVIIDVPFEAQREWGDENNRGIEVEISKLPKGVKIIRFVNSW